MVQALRLEELQRAKDQKRQRELERKEAEEASVKDLEDWERSLLALAEPWAVQTMWELPAIGHFLCLAQKALNLPEIVFYELERCLLMPRCSSFLAKVMTSLLLHPNKRANAHRRPPLPYRKWEAELRRRVQDWYRSLARAEDQMARAELLGLSHQFFWTLGEVSPLEETPFHMLTFKQRVWLLKGLCDHVYETQKDVQGAVLAQPIHECRESVLGYDAQENAYIHFPHFCGADLRIYRQSPCAAMEFPLPLLHVKRSQEEPEGSEVKLETHVMKEPNAWKEESLADGEDLGQKCSSSIFSWSLDSGSARGTFTEEERLKDEGEPSFGVGESRYKGVSHANHMTCEDQSPRQKKKDMKKPKLSLKRRTAKSSLTRAATAVKKRDRRKRRKLGNGVDGKLSLRRPVGSALLQTGPSFQLICSSLEDLRVLISKTQDQLQQLNGGKKRSDRRPNRRAVVKELRITLIRLLNELLPWEPKLVKAFQRNRARLKKECDDFKKHPEYENFIREPMDVCKEMQDGEVNAMKEEGTESVNHLGNHESRCQVDGPEIVMQASDSGPFTRSSRRRQSGAISDELSLCKRGKIDPESSLTSEVNVEVASREQTTGIPRVLALPQPLSSFQGSCKPIQALLAKSVGNKVTLISHPKAAVMAQILRDNNKTSVALPPVRLSTTCSPAEPETTSTTESTEQVVYKTAGGVGLLRKGITSAQTISDKKSMQQVVILPSNLLIQSTENKASASLPKTTTYLSNASGFTIPENRVPVQQVAPLIDTSTARTPSAVVTPNLRTLKSVSGGSAMPKKTPEPKVAVSKSASSGPTKPDANQELRTVCIRDSQSILVTTRGGNTGVVKVQTSESGTGALPPSPVFTISPQLQAFLVSKSSTPTTQAVSDTVSANSLLGVTPQSLSKRVSSSTFVPGTVPQSTLNQNSNDLAKTSIPGKSALLSTSKESHSVRITAKDIQGFQENTVSECGTKPLQKRPLPGSPTAFQKVFLVSPSPNIPSPASKISVSTATCTMPGSRVMFISNSALNVQNEASASGVNLSSTSTPALKVIPKSGTTLSCTSSGTSIQSIGVPGLMSRILGTNKNMPSAIETSGKTTPLIVSRVPATSTSSGLQIGQKTCLVASRNPSESSLKVPGTVDGKTLTFSTLGTGHMASSALLSVVKPDVPSSISTLNALHCKPTISSSYSGILINKHTTFPVDVNTDKTPMITSLCTSRSLVKTATSGVSSPLALSSLSPVVMTSGLRPPTSTAKSVQEKIVINTTAPLAPGTQLVINNTRFVVPSQGLAPGSHVLLINSCPGGLQSLSSGSPVPQGPNTSTPITVPSVVQGMRSVTPVRLPSPKVGLSDRINQQLSTRTPMSVSGLSQALRSGVSSDIVRLPIFQTSVTPSEGIKETSPLQGGLLSTTSPMLLKGRPSRNQVVPPIKTSVAHHSPMVTVPPITSMISRMQKLPVAMVPPIGGATTPIASVPPYMNSVIMTPIRPGTMGKPTISPHPLQGQNMVPSPSKLLLSPDGAILNIVQASSIQVLAKPMVSSSSSSVTVPTLNINDPMRKPDTFERSNH
ncbi:putative bromodomain-containing protein 10 isoform X2 [Siphateles boraxobius]